jgi:hypothetical protein
MDTHPQQAENIPLDQDLAAVVRAIDPILEELVDGATKGALYGEDLIDIAVRIRTILHEAVARQSGVAAAAIPQAEQR